jgi:hypothetical protein
MHRTASVVSLALALVLVSGCKKKQSWSPGCQKAQAMTAPWTELSLPVGNGRVCESDDKRVELQYLEGDRPGWEQKYDEAMVAAGLVKDRCSDASCTYKKDDFKATVQVIQAKKWVTVIVRR